METKNNTQGVVVLIKKVELINKTTLKEGRLLGEGHQSDSLQCKK